jgi:hypothetical protein
MKRSTRWFQNNAQQDTTSRLSILPVLARTGPDNPSEPVINESTQGKTYFKVGESEVEGEGGEVAG